jgi:uncharacterized protein (DUF488 family)
MINIIYTIGHSTKTAKELIKIIKAHGVKKVVDVRTIPKSRHNPQFNLDTIRESLKKAGLKYEHMEILGGLRKADKNSKNTGWRNLSFRGFADYMQTEKFEEGLTRLKKVASKQPTAIMCAEALPWRCHRSLIADAFTVQKWKVFHIMSQKTAQEHKLTPFLKVRKGKFLYL